MKDLGSYLLFLSALVVGFSLASQAGVNSQLRAALSSPIQAAFISFLIGTVLLGVILLVQRDKWFSFSEALNVPWWAWLGGFFVHLILQFQFIWHQN